MEIKNVALSLAWLSVVVMGLSHLSVSAADSRDVKMDLTNAIQHIVNVKLIGWWNDSATLKNAGSRLVWVETNNFILSKEESNLKNTIDGSSSYSNILWWVSNKIQWWTASTILWWESNINNGEYSTILWWNTNKIGEGKETHYSTIIGWSYNRIGKDKESHYSTIVGWNNNRVDWDYSAVLWNSAEVVWDNSVALWNNTKNNANNSFLWTDGDASRGTLSESNVFAVKAEHWMVVNANAPHNFAQLTIWWSLVINKWDTAVDTCDSEHEWVLKVVDGDSGHTCFCSCSRDGYWYSLYGQWRCEWKCNKIEKKPGCGTSYAVCSNGSDWYKFVWSCNSDSKPVAWEWAYFVDSEGKVHWTCQTDAGITKIDDDGHFAKCVSSTRDDSLCSNA